MRRGIKKLIVTATNTIRSSWSARLATYSIGTDSSYSPAPHGREGAAREALPVEVPAATYCVGWSLLMIRYQASHGGYGAT